MRPCIFRFHVKVITTVLKQRRMKLLKTVFQSIEQEAGSHLFWPLLHIHTES